VKFPKQTPAKDSTREKGSYLQSNVTVVRFREPTNARMASNMTQYVFDHSELASVIPGGNRLITSEATKSRPCKSINSNGRPAVFGPTACAFVGGSQDDKGRF